MSLALFQNVPPKGTPVVITEQPGAPAAPGAPAGQAAPPGGGFLMSVLPFIILVPFLFMMFRRQKKESAERAKLKKGDRIASQSGLIGELVELDERIAKVKIAPGLTVQMVASSISPLPEEKKDDAKVVTADAKK